MKNSTSSATPSRRTWVVTISLKYSWFTPLATRSAHTTSWIMFIKMTGWGKILLTWVPRSSRTTCMISLRELATMHRSLSQTTSGLWGTSTTPLVVPLLEGLIKDQVLLKWDRPNYMWISSSPFKLYPVQILEHWRLAQTLHLVMAPLHQSVLTIQPPWLLPLKSTPLLMLSKTTFMQRWMRLITSPSSAMLRFPTALSSLRRSMRSSCNSSNCILMWSTSPNIMSMRGRPLLYPTLVSTSNPSWCGMGRCSLPTSTFPTLSAMRSHVEELLHPVWNSSFSSLLPFYIYPSLY